MLALLYGDGNFDRSLDIVNSAGWDTDCNSGNLGALLGIWGGLKVIDEGHDWRSPLADRLLIPTADPGNAISDALREATKLVELGYRSAGHDYVPPKGGARFHFSAPGSLQGFSANDERTVIRNETTSSGRMLHILSAAQRSAVLTPTFATPESLQASRYPLDMSPTLYSGQRVRSTVLCARGFPGCQSAQIVIRVYDAHDRLTEIFGPSQQLSTEGTDIEWVIPDTEGQPIQAVGVQVRSECGVDAYLDRLTWDGVPSTRFLRPAVGGTAWRRAWANATEYDHDEPEESFRLIQNRGRGLMLTGTQEWENYCVSAAMLPHAASAMGLVARARGLREYVALRWGADGTLALLHRHRGKDQVLSEVGRPLTGGILGLAVNADTIVGSIDGNNIVEATCANVAACGAIGMFVEDGRVGVDYVAVNPL